MLRWALGEALEPAYSQVYFPNFDWLARLLACRYQCPFLWLEDGFSSYVIDFARPDRAAVNRHPQGARLGEQVQAALLYEPALAMRGDSLPNRPLPKLSPGDGELLALLNFIFQYRRPPWLPRFLFLEQSFRAEGIPGNDLELMRLCQQAVGPENFGVKPHPRNGDDLPQRLGLSRRVELRVPWELFLLNEGPDRCCLVTVCSNGALSGRLRERSLSFPAFLVGTELLRLGGRKNLAAIVGTAVLASSVRQTSFTALRASDYAGDGELPVGAASLIPSCLGNLTLRNSHE